MTLTLTLSKPWPAVEVSHTFTGSGGTIGREPSSSWVLTHDEVSSRHAVITFGNGAFYIEDASRNGVSVGSPDNRLGRGGSYALKPGDVIFIGPYEIDVSVENRTESQDVRPLDDPLPQDEPFARARGFEAQLPWLAPPPVPRPPSTEVVGTPPNTVAPSPGVTPSARAAPPAGTSSRPGWGTRDLSEVLAAAGLPAAQASPELAGDLGRILRVVVGGLLDLLHSQQHIKDEFQVRQTAFRRSDNNPLKFSVNVEDALHNLLLKRNAAYLRGVDAFIDAFDDLRDHQLAMLAGMRVAFEGMLADFDPDRIQKEFDRKISKPSMPLIPARLRYWDLYREKRVEMMKDPDAAFTRLFGDEFARAYEEQFRELRARRRAVAAEAARGRDDEDTLKVPGSTAPVPFEPEPVAPWLDGLLGGHYSPPGTIPDPGAEAPSAGTDGAQIPEGYDPLAPDESLPGMLVPDSSAGSTTRSDSSELPEASQLPPPTAPPRPPGGARSTDPAPARPGSSPVPPTSERRDDPDLERDFDRAYEPRSITTSARCSVFAPPSVACGESFLLQAFVHTRRQQRQVSSLAKVYDSSSEIRGATHLEHDLRPGTRLTFSVVLPGAQVNEPVQSLNWRGDPESVQFGITIPHECPPGNLIGTVSVSDGSVPIGHVKFVLLVVGEGPRATAVPHSLPQQSWKRYRYAFISYASPDRAEVLKRVQMLDRVSIEFFQDLLSLEPGERWAKALYKHIDQSDVLFLFWSTAAKESKWVIKEVRYAIECRKGDDLAPPEIVPVLIEGPPPVAPPPELKDLHFDDRFLYFIAGSA